MAIHARTHVPVATVSAPRIFVTIWPGNWHLASLSLANMSHSTEAYTAKLYPIATPQSQLKKDHESHVQILASLRQSVGAVIKLMMLPNISSSTNSRHICCDPQEKVSLHSFFFLLQFIVVSVRSEKSICAPHRFLQRGKFQTKIPQFSVYCTASPAPSLALPVY